MKFEVEHPDFKAQRIVVETPGIFRKAINRVRVIDYIISDE